jgi:centromere protein C
MQLTFFVHEGKVAVDMSAGEGCEVNSFAITKGGVWVVPRGE